MCPGCWYSVAYYQGNKQCLFSGYYC